MDKALITFLLLVGSLHAQILRPILQPQPSGGGGGAITYTHVGTDATENFSGTSKTMILAQAPTAGNILACGFITFTAVTALSATDNGNTMTVSPRSPSSFISGAGQLYMLYFDPVPAGLTTSLAFAWTTTTSDGQDFCAEFHPSSTSVFDNDAIDPHTGSATTTINTPSITPANSGELLFACGSPTTAVTAPASSATLGVWTGLTVGINDSVACEYDLSSAGSPAVQFTITSSASWVSGIEAFH